MASLLKASAKGDEPLRVTAGEAAYVVRVVRQPAPAPSIWSGYDPEQVREALRQSAELPARVVDPDELDELIAELKAEREQDTSSRSNW